MAVAALLLIVGGAGACQDDDAGFRAYLPQLRAQAITAGVRPETVDATLADLRFEPRIVPLDRAQTAPPSAGPSTANYLAQHVDANRVARGRRAYAVQAPRYGAARDGVPEAVAVAIWGSETDYGSALGAFDLPSALATLAYEGRRRPLFAGEFVAALQMLDRGVPRARLRGSWAGAMGGPQFLPSVYLREARDGDGDGFADIWTSGADTLASIAAYLADAGWRPGQPWGLAVGVPPSLDRAALTTRLIAPRCPRVFVRHSAWRTMAEWRALGLLPQSGVWPQDRVMATLIEPDGPGGGAWLVTGNYRAILDYNCSTNYALAVGELSDAIAGTPGGQ